MTKVQYGSLPIQYCNGKTYYIGDLHSEAYKAFSLIEQIINDGFSADDRIVFLGDLFDRGLFSAKLVEILVQLNRSYPGQIFFVKGNHDWMLQHYLITGRQDWFAYLRVTLEDFKTSWNLPDILPNTIMDALVAHGFDEITRKIIPYYETEDVVATHAPLDMTTVYMFAGRECLDYKEDYADRINHPEFKYLLDRMEYEILWQNTSETLEIKGFDKFHICGHQPGPGKQKHPRIFKDRAFIDTGCGKGDRPCTALIYPGKRYLQSK